jgi:hypothetical protein
MFIVPLHSESVADVKAHRCQVPRQLDMQLLPASRLFYGKRHVGVGCVHCGRLCALRTL